MAKKDAAREALTRVPSSMAVRMLGVDRQTLYGMAKRGEIKTARTPTGRMLWNVAEYLEDASEEAA
jgi:predicted site-specific integrase-resolvase